MRITKREAIAFRMPMRETVKFATGQLSALDHLLVRVYTDEGLMGQSEAPSRPMVYGARERACRIDETRAKAG